MSEEPAAALKAQRDELARALAERSAQLDSVTRDFDEFTHSVSHDLRSPLRAIEGFAQILAEDHAKNLDRDGQRSVSILASAARKASLLIDDLLVLSRLVRKPFIPEIVNMNELVAQTLKGLGASAGPAKFKVETLPAAWGDPAWLGAALEQLLANATKFSRVREQPVIEIGATTEPQQILYHIRDNGVGFDPKYAGRLFGVFQRLHGNEEFEGRGMGLAIVRRVIHQHGGKTWAEGEPDRGAVFFFSLPMRGTPPQS
jgi:light-regulated signal transduction histidine kinase (bacteriophytochrome)